MRRCYNSRYILVGMSQMDGCKRQAAFQSAQEGQSDAVHGMYGEANRLEFHCLPLARSGRGESSHARASIASCSALQ